MAKYELVYFHGRGRAEASRQVLVAAGQDFTDTRVEFSDWPALKPDTPFGQLPILKVGADVITQSLAVLSFLAREHGLAGDSSLDQAKVDMIVQAIDELLTHTINAIFDKDETKKAEIRKKAEEEIFPKVLGNLEKLAGEKFFVNNKLSAADIFLHVLLDRNPLHVELSNYRKLQAIVGNVKANPGIKAWLQKRPDTQF